MANDLAQVLIPVMVAIIASVPGVLAYLASRRQQIRADGDSALVAWQSLVAPLREEVAQLRVEIDELQAQLDSHKERIQHLERENGMLRSGAELLLHQVKSNGIKPVWGERELKYE